MISRVDREEQKIVLKVPTYGPFTCSTIGFSLPPSITANRLINKQYGGKFLDELSVNGKSKGNYCQFFFEPEVEKKNKPTQLPCVPSVWDFYPLKLP